MTGRPSNNRDVRRLRAVEPDAGQNWRVMKLVGTGDIILGALVGAAGFFGVLGEDSVLLIVLGGAMMLTGAVIALLGRYKLSRIESPARRRG